MVLTSDDVESILTINDTISVLEKSFIELSRKQVNMTDRDVFVLEDKNGWFGIMTAHVKNMAALGTKLVTVFPKNIEINKPTTQAVISLIDVNTGELIGIIDGSLITGMRTGATTGIATKYLSKKNSSKLIHISSTSVYGEQKGLVDENCKKLRPKSPYAKVKVIEENILKKNKDKISFVSYRFGTISGVSMGMRFHTAINKFCFCALLGKPLPVWKSMMNKPRPYLSLKDAFKVIKFTIENNFFNNETFNILSENLTLKKIIGYFKKYKKTIKIKYEKSKLVNQYSYRVSSEKFTRKALLLKSNIYHDIKFTLKMFRNINNEM